MAAILTSYDLKGKKDSFANWISNLSPTDTFFVSVTGKEQVKNTLFQWQTDQLAAVDKNNAQDEASNAIAAKPKTTKVYQNKTQILRKAVEVSDTADAISTWGRGKELAYQMEKAGREIKRDLEAILLSDQKATPTLAAGTPTGGTNDAEQEPGSTAVHDPDAAVVAATAPRKTACFRRLVGTGTDGSTADPDTGAVVVAKTATTDVLTEKDLFDMTKQLYIAGADANIIMFHPNHSAFFSSLMEVGVAGGSRIKMIDNMETTLNKFVGTVIDPLGQEFKLVPNRWMDPNFIYIFNPKDWTQMVLREPQKIKLAKRGSTERYMIEMEIGLRHRNPYASAVISLKDLT